MSGAQAAGIADHRPVRSRPIAASGGPGSPPCPEATGHHRRSSRMGRPDRCLFGYRPHSKIPWRLVEDSDEQQTIQVIRQLALDHPEIGPRTICRTLDSLGRNRRGKRWATGGHSLVAAIIKRESRPLGR